MSTDYVAEFDEVKAQYADMRESMPKVMQTYGKLHHAAMTEGVLDPKIKELIALGIGISSRCEGCMASHIRSAYHHGATLEEITDTIGVAIMMGGGPSTVYGGKALDMAKAFHRGEE